jgi:hypothetical protein
MIAYTLVSTNHQSRVDYRPSLERSWLWLQDDVPKPLEMKPACKYWWSSFLYHKDRWCIINWATLHRASRRQRPSRKNSSLHLQWTSIRQPRPNENQEWLMKDHTATCNLIPWIGQKNRQLGRGLCSLDLKSRALFDKFKNRWRIVSKDMELQHTLRDDSTLTLGFKWRVTARLKLGGGRPPTPLMMI